MKNKGPVFVILLIICAAMLSFINNAPFDELAINAGLPRADYKMKDISGKELSLNDVKTAKGLLVIFSCNTCPYVKMNELRLKEYSDFCIASGIGCILINSNEAQRNEDDSFEEMVKYYAAQRLKCAYTIDEKSQMANAFGAGGTPQCFLFNSKGLVYKGAIDDNVKEQASVKEAYLKNALIALLKGELPKTRETKSIGCTIKRAE